MAESDKERAPGMGVDAGGGPVVDPTKNVQALVIAESKRQDDLRLASEKYNEKVAEYVEKVASIKADCAKEIANIRVEYAKEFNALESGRLNAIRQVDVLAVNTAVDRAAAATQALAQTTASNAENIRNAMTTTAAAIATQLANTVSAITDRIGSLEKSSYTGAGRSTMSDPALAEMMLEIKALRQEQSLGAGKTQGLNASWAILIGAAAVIVAILGVASFFRPQVQPVTQYVPQQYQQSLPVQPVKP
jgi:hypothetical protein